MREYQPFLATWPLLLLPLILFLAAQWLVERRQLRPPTLVAAIGTIALLFGLTCVSFVISPQPPTSAHPNVTIGRSFAPVAGGIVSYVCVLATSYHCLRRRSWGLRILSVAISSVVGFSLGLLVLFYVTCMVGYGCI